MTNVQRFWSEHDASLSVYMSSAEDALSHDLYRGMPAWFNGYYAHFQRRSVTALLARCGSLDGRRVLDAGCGTGRWSGLLAEAGAWPVGVDVGLQALRLASERHQGACFAAAALPWLSFPDGTFDLAITITVLQHIPRRWQPEAVASLARVLKPGGRLVAYELVDPGDLAPHVFANSTGVWWTMFGAAGLHRVAYVPCEYLPYIRWFQTLRKRFRRREPPGSAALDVSAVAESLEKRPALAWVVRMVIAASYPLEYLASWLLPKGWARVGGFLSVRE